ncbi:hypothetical protein ACFQJB_01850 [Halonotius sp. GCM10025705]
MSEAYAHDTALVSEGSTSYDRFVDGAIALSIVAFATTLVALVGSSRWEQPGRHSATTF